MSDQQRILFDREPEPWEKDDQENRLVASVVFAEGPGGTFDYLVPDRLAELVEAGVRVRAPLGRGNRPLTGYLVAMETKPAGSRPLKELVGVVDPRSLLNPAMLRLTRWIADHYLCPWGQVLEAVVPAGVAGRAPAWSPCSPPRPIWPSGWKSRPSRRSSVKCWMPCWLLPSR
jgi:primosomal protein N' (replication factor Y)